MNEIKVPGLIYSSIVALGVVVVDYFTTGLGAGWMYAPLVLAAVSIVLKAITTNVPPETEAAPDGAMGSPVRPVERRSKLRTFLLG